MIAASAGVLLLAGAALLQGGALTSGSIHGLEADRVQQVAEARLGVPGEASFALVFRSDSLSFDDPAFQAALAKALGPIETRPDVSWVKSPLAVPAALASRFVSEDRHSALALVAMKGDVPAAMRAYAPLREAIDAGPLEVLATGHLAFMHDLDTTLERDLRKAELVSLPLALVVLVLVFGGFVAASLPIGIGALAVVSGVGAVLALSHRVEMAQYTLNVVSLVGLGVAIDYSLFIVSRHRDELSRGVSVEEALLATLATAGRAVAFSGLAVMVGLSGLLFFRGSYLASMGLAGAVVVLLAVGFALTLLPALLVVLGPNIEKWRVRKPRALVGTGRWHRVALWVMRHPVLVLLPTLALLLALGLPFLKLELAAADETVLPAQAEARRGFEALRRGFPSQSADRILALVRFPNGRAFSPERVPALYEFTRKIAKIPGVTKVESIVDLDASLTESMYALLARMPERARPPELNAAIALLAPDEYAAVWVLTAGATSSPENEAIVHALRASRAVGDGMLEVGGRTAHDMDATAWIRARAAPAAGFVVLLTCVVLFALLGSVVLPVKAVLMNLLSISASFGAMVWIFQEGHLAGLFGFTPHPLEPALPVLLFCLVFGLSMDYEVLLLSRMQEEWRRTGDNTRAVAEGLEKSAGLITSAAAIMVAVFAAFAGATVVVVQAMGVGLALAVALDATLVRVLVVPATMRLFGALNWWAPAMVARRFEARRDRHGPVTHGP